jgi:hypothetical protein
MTFLKYLSSLLIGSLLLLLSACGGDDNAPTPSTISAPVVAGLFQPEGQLTVGFTITGTYTVGNVFTAQLSDGTGSFTSPITIGTLSSLTAGTINATLPASVANGSAYRIRVIASAPATTGADNGVNLSIAAPTMTISNIAATTVISPGKQIMVTTNTEGTFASCNSFTLQLSNAAGEFTSPVSLGTVNGTTLNNSQQASLPNNATPGTGYRVRWVSSCPVVTGTPSLPFTIVLPTLGIPQLVANQVAGGEVSVRIPFADGPWNAGNSVSVQLSDASGNFGSPVTISTLSTTLGTSGTQQLVTGYIPANTPAGSGYKIRVVTNSPQVISESTPSFSIGELPTLTIEPAAPVFTKMYAGTRFSMNYLFKISRTGNINSLNNVRFEISNASQTFTGTVLTVSLSATQVNELVSIGSTTIVVGLNSTIGNGTRKFRANATTHPGVISPELTFSVGQTSIGGLTGEVENTPYQFNTNLAFYNTNTASYVNNKVMFALGESNSSLYGEVTMRTFIGFNLSNENIQTGSQTGSVIIHLLNSAGQQVAIYANNNATISVSGTASGYTATIENASLSRTFGSVGNTTLNVQSLSCGFTMQ